MSDIDMDLDNQESSSDFTKDSPMPNIWSLDNGKEDTETSSSDKNKDDASVPSVFSADDGDELEKPSFLRRLKNKRSKDKPEEEKKSGK